MRHAYLLLMLPAFAAAIVAVACSDGASSKTPSGDGGEPFVDAPPPEPPSSAPSGPAGTGLATGLPCDVQGILENRCIACHGMGSSTPLLDYDDLVAPSKKRPGGTMAEASLYEMRMTSMPPAPAVPPEDDEVASFEAWLSAGTPKNPLSCTDVPPRAPASDGGTNAGPDGGVSCTSAKLWTQGNQPSPLMNPGEACNACHQVQGGPNLRLAGTVYPSLREPDDCIGSAPPPPIRVLVTDTRGNVFDLPVNDSGNFLTSAGDKPRPPFKVVVTNGTQTRSMVGSVTSGDCNSCHGVDGANGAPGRILAPGP